MRVTSRPELAGTSIDWTTSTPPDGSVSLASGAISDAPPLGSTARSSSAIGSACVSSATTSTRMTPTVVDGPSDTVYVNWKEPGTEPVNVRMPRDRSADTDVPAGGVPAATSEIASPFGSVSFAIGSIARASPTRAT